MKIIKKISLFILSAALICSCSDTEKTTKLSEAEASVSTSVGADEITVTEAVGKDTEKTPYIIPTTTAVSSDTTAKSTSAATTSTSTTAASTTVATSAETSAVTTTSSVTAASEATTTATSITTTTAATTTTATSAVTASATTMAEITTAQTDKPEKTVTAEEITAAMRVGWTLGNTFDAYDPYWVAEPDAYDYETCWGNPETTKEMIAAVKAAGFGAVKINVTWEEHIGTAPDYTINGEWLNRIEEVVNYILDCDMYAFINVHHDSSRNCSLRWLAMSGEGYDESVGKFEKLWKQIAEHFSGYDERLLFISLGEPVGGDSWDSDSNSIEILNKFNALFVKTIRDSGGYNRTRFLVLPTHGASIAEKSVKGLVLPDDDRLIVAVHSYTPNEFCFSETTLTWTTSTDKWGSNEDKKQLTDGFKLLYDQFVSKGIPVIIGEFGACAKNNTAERCKWAEFYVSEARKYGIVCFWWDDGGTDEGKMSLLNRAALEWYFPELVKAITGVYP